MSSTFSGDETAPFFGFLGAAAALVFSCNPIYSSAYVLIWIEEDLVFFFFFYIYNYLYIYLC